MTAPGSQKPNLDIEEVIYNAEQSLIAWKLQQSTTYNISNNNNNNAETSTVIAQHVEVKALHRDAAIERFPQPKSRSQSARSDTLRTAREWIEHYGSCDLLEIYSYDKSELTK